MGCSNSVSPNSKFYLLHNASDSVKGASAVSVEKLKVQFPDYLKQPNLAMKLTSHQLHYAQYHKWAEPLAVSFKKAVKVELKKQNQQSNTMPALFIDVEHFHVSEHASVILSGSYQILMKEPNKNQYFDFYIEQKLAEDGYDHAVIQQRKLVTKLVSEIIQSW